MGRSGKKHESLVVFAEADKAAGLNDVVLLGGTPGACELPVHPQGTAARPTGRVTTGNVLRLLEWQQFRCALTGRSLMPDTASLDHIVPVRLGGEHRIENVQVLHKDVNRAKTTMTNEEFIQLCREVVEHAAQQDPEGEE
jgi:hypothetical protein